MSKELTQKQDTPIVEYNGASMMNIIEKAALNPDIDMDKMERLLEMKERLDAKDEIKQFNLAMSEAQSKMGRISTDATNPQTRSKYASYGKLDKVLRPIYTDAGFSLSFDSKRADENTITVLCYVSHKAGHTRTYTADMDASGKGAKGGDVMTKTHATGSAMSYGMRYLLKLIFNVAIGEEDDDGNGANIQRISEEQANEIHAKINDNGLDMAAFLGWLKKTLKCNSIEEINQNGYGTVINTLNTSIANKAKKK